MPVTLTAMTLTPTWTGKRLTIEGDASVREAVAITLAGCGNDTSIVLKVSSENGRVDYAKFPNLPGDAWTVSGADLTGTLSLNTDLLVAAFAPKEPGDRLDCVWTVASVVNSNLYAKGCKQIGNWIEDADDPVAYSTPLADDIEVLEESLGDLSAAFGAHTHNGTAAGGMRVAHSNLVGAGTVSHTDIEAALTNLSSGVATNASNIQNNADAIAQLDGEAVKSASFAAVAAVTESTATVKKLVAKINEILAILKG